MDESVVVCSRAQAAMPLETRFICGWWFPKEIGYILENEPKGCPGVRAQMKVTTAFGAFLDPVADKIMVSTVLVLLAVSPPEPLSHKDLAIPVVIMIGREITMSALREWAASSGGGAHKVLLPCNLQLSMEFTTCHLLKRGRSV